MAYKFRYIEKIIGIFIVGAILILIATIIFIARGKKLLVKKNYYYTIFNSANSLTLGMPVKYKGLNIGTVKEIVLTRGNKIKVKFYVLAEYADRVKKDSVVNIISPLIGEKTIELTEGSTNSKIARPNSYLYSVDSKIGKKYLALQLANKKPSATDEIIQNIQKLTAQLSNPNGYLIKTLKNIEKTTADLSHITSQNTNQINEMIKNLKDTSKELKMVVKQLRSNPLLKWGYKQK